MPENDTHAANRRVHWTESDHERSRRQELDEQGLDRTAFTTLRIALEAHATSSQESLPTGFKPSEPPSMDAGMNAPSDSLHPFEVPGVYIDPNELAGLPNIVGSPAEMEIQTETEVEHNGLPFPSQTASTGKHKTGFLSLFSLRSRRGREHNHPSSRHQEKKIRRQSSNLIAGAGVLSALLALQEMDELSLPATPRPSSSPHTRPAGSRTYSTSSSLSETISRPLSLIPGRVQNQRPAAQRNAAGVFGALVATTGNITGAAAPVNSTLQPDIKAKGYRVSRYAAPEISTRSVTRVPQLPRITIPQSTIDTGSSSTAAHSPEAKDSHPVFMSAPSTPLGTRRRFAGALSNLPRPFSRVESVPNTPHSEAESDGGYFMPRPAWPGSCAPPGEFNEKTSRRDQQAEWRLKKRRKKAQVFITQHVAAVRARHDFLFRLARIMMMFGAPTHRLPAQLQATARVLDVPLACVYLPDVMIISIDDVQTQTSSVKLIRQGSALDLEKLADAYAVYWRVIHDEVSVTDASAELDALMMRPPCYGIWQLLLIGGGCSFAICINAFSGSFLDALISFPLGALLVGVQMLSARNELFSAVFEIVIATLQSFIAGALASTRHVCYSAVASASVVLILPGFIVLSGALEIANRNIVSGAVRLCYAIVYSLFLGFGLAAGAQIFGRITGTHIIGSTDYTCSQTHDPHGAWWQRTPSPYFAFVTVPLYSFVLSLRQQAPLRRIKDLALLVLIACAGWTSNHFVGLAFPGQSDIAAAVGAFVVGVVANVYGRLARANAFAIMITGILFQLPSGLGNGGLLDFAGDASAGQANATTYLSGFRTALQLVSVAIGLTVGLGFSLLVVHPIQSRKRAAGIFSL